MPVSLHERPDMLLALPIKGESFLFRRAGRAVLVDGGYKGDKIPDKLKRHVKDLERLDVVLCTHGDSDHAGGLPNLLDKWAGRVGQLWLPGRWVDVIPQLARDPAGFLGELIGELDAALEKPDEQLLRAIRDAGEESPRKGQDDIQSEPLDHDGSLFEGWDDDPDDDLGPGDPPPEPGWFEELRIAKEQLASDADAARAFDAARKRARYRKGRASAAPGISIVSYWLGLIETAEAIRGIAMAAIRHGIRTRWFDFEAFERTRRASGGARRFLVPINAVEQAPPPTSLRLYMQLTLINRQSLAFFAPPGRGRHGFLFCGDSPLGDGPGFANSFLPHLPMPFPVVIATAPHHGSESNRAAYAHLNAWAWVGVLLRAGGSMKQPGQTFLDQQDCLRLCTKCPRLKYAPMLSGVIAPRPWWMLHTVGRICDCSNPTGGGAGTGDSV